MPEDPFYARKPIPDSFVSDVGDTGLSRQEEYLSRERKYSTANGGDIRNFSNPSALGKDKKKKGSLSKDPFYQRKQIPDALISGVGVTGLTAQEEFLNRERKYSLADGSDARKFSSAKGLEPSNDPYYRKPVNLALVKDVGQTGNSQAEDFQVRENKQSMFQLSDDPFALVTGKGHRQSVSGPAMAEFAAQAHRRKSSAIAPHEAHAAHEPHHSGYGGEKLAPIESRPEGAPASTTEGFSEAESSTNGHGLLAHLHKPQNGQHDEIEHFDDPDSVGPHDMR